MGRRIEKNKTHGLRYRQFNKTKKEMMIRRRIKEYAKQAIYNAILLTS